MQDAAITLFLNERKSAWLKDKLKSIKNEDERHSIENQANEKFDLTNWLPDAAKRASQLSMVSHPGKFTHPGARISPVIAQSSQFADGFLRTGNVSADFDVLGNAAALDVYKFLSLVLDDGQTILSHLDRNTEWIKQQFNMQSSYSELRQGLLSIKTLKVAQVKTSEKIKQVYFPIDGGYHLLSLLTPSGLMFKLKERINAIRFAEETKQAREARRNRQHHDTGYQEFYGLTEIGFGGTKPQNISVLNNRNGGTAYLLPSLPPPLALNNLQPPKTDFFLQSLYAKHFLEKFQALHALFNENVPSNMHVREGRDYWLLQIAEQVMETVWALRELPGGWSEHGRLPPAQTIWLDQNHAEQREQEDDWLDAVITALADWLAISYKNLIGVRHAAALGDAELKHIREVFSDNREDLR